MLRNICIAATLSVALAFAASAQRNRGGGGGFGGGGGGFGVGAVQDKSETIAKELKLSKELRAEVDAVLDDAQKQTTPLLVKIREGRAAFIDSTMGDKPPEPALKNITELYAQAVGIEVNAVAKVIAKLDDKQKAKAAKVFDMSGMFLSGNWRKSK